MKKILTLSLSLLFVFSTFVVAQTPDSSTSSRKARSPSDSSGNNRSSESERKRPPVFRANKHQVNQAQTILKSRGFYTGETTGKLDAATRSGLKEYQKAEGLKVTGTLNKATLEKMGIELTEKQKAM
jgi:peptidoglycan hydrolase-like protein with peptidoglycan-binding domain